MFDRPRSVLFGGWTAALLIDIDRSRHVMFEDERRIGTGITSHRYARVSP